MTRKDASLARSDALRAGHGPRRHAWLVPVATIALAAGASLCFLDGDDGIPLPEDGATITTVAHGRAVFVRRDGKQVNAYVADPHHLDDEPLWWCEEEGAFFGPFHGELFDSYGAAIAGPARRSLDRLHVAVDGQEIRIRGEVIRGAPRDRSRETHNLADALGEKAAATYRHDPSSFCAGPLESAEIGDTWWDRLRATIRDMTRDGASPAHP